MILNWKERVKLFIVTGNKSDLICILLNTLIILKKKRRGGGGVGKEDKDIRK